MNLPTRRTVLRPPTDGDSDAVHAYASDTETTRYMLFGPNGESDTREFLQRAHAHSQQQPRIDYEFLVDLEGVGPIGGCGLHISREYSGSAELGYIIRRDYWGQGFATEISQRLIRFGFRELMLQRIFARCHPDNPASARVMEKCGMIYEGRLRSVVYTKGEWWDFQQYSILRDEWELSASAESVQSVF